MKKQIGYLLVLVTLFILFAGPVYSESDVFKTNVVGQVSLKLRSYFIERHFDLTGTQQSLAYGGWLDYTTPTTWHGLSGGAALYTSQGAFFTDSDKGGGGILLPNQDGFSVLGMAYLQGEYLDTIGRVYRQKIDSPLLNFYDVKMAPVTFEAYSLYNSSIPETTLTFAYVDKIKGWTDTTFHSMTYAAGITNADRGTWMAGAVVTPTSNYTLQVWNYLTEDYLNSVFGQADGLFELDEKLTLALSAQGLDQRDVGEAFGGDFHTGFLGIQSVLGVIGLELTLAYTITDGDHDIVNPWASYPGYTSIMEEDNNLAGQKTWLLGLAYDFSEIGIHGLSAFSSHTDATSPDSGEHASPNQQETDLTIDYKPAGIFENLWFRFRISQVNQQGAGANDYNDMRIIVNYDLSNLL